MAQLAPGLPQEASSCLGASWKLYGHADGLFRDPLHSPRKTPSGLSVFLDLQDLIVHLQTYKRLLGSFRDARGPPAAGGLPARPRTTCPHPLSLEFLLGSLGPVSLGSRESSVLAEMFCSINVLLTNESCRQLWFLLFVC